MKKPQIPLLMIVVLLSLTVLLPLPLSAGDLAGKLSSSTHSTNVWSSNNKITINWTKPSSCTNLLGETSTVTGYSFVWSNEPLRQDGSNMPDTSPELDANVTTTTSNALSDSQSIYFIIRTLCEGGSKFEADQIGPFFIDSTAPARVTNFTATAGNGQVSLSWTNPGDADFGGVVIRSSTTGYPANKDAGTAVLTTTDNTSSYINTGLTNGQQYYYSIFTYDKRGGNWTPNYSSAVNATATPVASVTGTPAQVSSHNPIANATDVPVTSTISVTFNKDMQSSSFTTSTVVLARSDNASATVNVSLSYSASSKTLTITPQTPLAYSTQYTLTIVAGGSGVKDSTGGQLDGNKDGTASNTGDNYAFNFTTAAYVLPVVSSFTPANGTTNVAPNQTITIAFSKNMQAQSVTSSSTIQITDNATGAVIAGTYSYNDLTKTTTFIPSANYTGGQVIKVTVKGGSSGVKDSNGIPMAADNVSFFTIKKTPLLSFSPSSPVSFGSILTNGTKDVTITVSNTGGSGGVALQIGAVTLGGADASKFSKPADTCQNNNSISSGQTCTITIRYTPAVAGTHTATLTIMSNSGNDNATLSTTTQIALTGVATIEPTPSITLDRNSVNFGTVGLTAGSDNVTITVSSNGTRALNLGNIRFTSTSQDNGTHFKRVGGTCQANSVLDNGSTCTIIIRYAPTVAGTHSDILSIYSDSGRTDNNTTTVVNAINLQGTAQQNSFTLNLLAGWNLISLPLQPENNAIGAVLAGIAGKYSIVWGYINNVWKGFDPADPEGSDLTVLDAGRGYWIKTTQATTLQITGSTPSSTINLASGWNLIGLNKNTSLSMGNALGSIAGKYLIVWGYTNGQWKGYDPQDADGSDLKGLDPGFGYWIKTNQATAWTLP